MNVLIIGFDNYKELDDTMQKLINDSQCYLFNVICGGVGQRSTSLAEEWAAKNGAPVAWISANDPDELMRKLDKETDYLVMKISDQLPQQFKLLMMKLRGEGKHGTIIR